MPPEPTQVEHIIFGKGTAIGAKSSFGTGLPLLRVEFNGTIRELLVGADFWQRVDEEVTHVFARMIAKEDERQATLKRRADSQRRYAKRRLRSEREKMEPSELGTEQMEPDGNDAEPGELAA